MNMIKKILIVLSIFVLSSCELKDFSDETDEFGIPYDISTTDIEQAFINDANLFSLTVEYVNYDIDGVEQIRTTYKIENNVGYNPDYDIYYKNVNDNANCIVAIDNFLEDGYVEHATTNYRYRLISDASKFIYDRLLPNPADFVLSNYEIVDGYYRYEVRYVSNVYLDIRVNSGNYIDQMRVMNVTKDEESVLEEYILSGHNNTFVDPPATKYMTPYEYELEVVKQSGFDVLEEDSDQLVLENEVYQATINLNSYQVQIVKGEDSFLYTGYDDLFDLKLFLENDESYIPIMDLLNVTNMLDQGRYNGCLLE